MDAYTSEATYNRARQDQNSITTRDYDKVSLAGHWPVYIYYLYASCATRKSRYSYCWHLSVSVCLSVIRNRRNMCYDEPWKCLDYGDMLPCGLLTFERAWSRDHATSLVTAVLPPPGQHCGTVCLNSFSNRTSPSDNSNNRWKRLCLVSWAAVPCVWTLRVLTRNLLTYLPWPLRIKVGGNAQFFFAPLIQSLNLVLF